MMDKHTPSSKASTFTLLNIAEAIWREAGIKPISTSTAHRIVEGANTTDLPVEELIAQLERFELLTVAGVEAGVASTISLTPLTRRLVEDEWKQRTTLGAEPTLAGGVLEHALAHH